MKILMSLPYARTFDIEPTTTDGSLELDIRASDWGKRGVKKYIHHTREAFRLARIARNYDALVLSTVCIEAFFLGRLHNSLFRRTKLVCFDFLMPQPGRLSATVRTWLRGVDSFLVIRRHDADTLHRRYSIGRDDCHFVHFPASSRISALDVEDGDYVYSAGLAHRDWPTLIDALAELPYKALISPGQSVELRPGMQDRVQVLPTLAPDAGRQLMARAGVVAVAMLDTLLPAGPLILLDAMAAGKAVVASDVNGTRDYIDDSVTGILVPPGNAGALARGLEAVMRSSDLRFRFGQAASQVAKDVYTVDALLAAITRVCAE